MLEDNDEKVVLRTSGAELALEKEKVQSIEEYSSSVKQVGKASPASQDELLKSLPPEVAAICEQINQRFQSAFTALNAFSGDLTLKLDASGRSQVVPPYPFACFIIF